MTSILLFAVIFGVFIQFSAALSYYPGYKLPSSKCPKYKVDRAVQDRTLNGLYYIQLMTSQTRPDPYRTVILKGDTNKFSIDFDFINEKTGKPESHNGHATLIEKPTRFFASVPTLEVFDRAMVTLISWDDCSYAIAHICKETCSAKGYDDGFIVFTRERCPDDDLQKTILNELTKRGADLKTIQSVYNGEC